MELSFLAKAIFLYDWIHGNVFQSSKQVKRAYTNLFFFLLTASCSQNLWCYELLIIVHLKGGSFSFLVVEVLPCLGGFITCMGGYFSTVKLDNTTQFNTLSRMFQWHSSKQAHWFGRFLQNVSGLKVLACSLDIDLNYVITMPQLCPSLQQLFLRRCSNFLDEFSQVCDLSSAFSWTQGLLLNFMAKFINF